MLSHVPEAARTVLSDIETLVLQTSYPVVLLASNLINSPDHTVRSQYLATCRRHVYRMGSWSCSDISRTSTDGNPVIRSSGEPKLRSPISSFERKGDRKGDQFSASIEYRHADGLGPTISTRRSSMTVNIHLPQAAG